MTLSEAANALQPDWKGVYTSIQRMVDDLDFEFKGPGWYEKKGDWLLVTEGKKVQLDSGSREPTEVTCCVARCWNGVDPRPALQMISNLPQEG